MQLDYLNMLHSSFLFLNSKNQSWKLPRILPFFIAEIWCHIFRNPDCYCRIVVWNLANVILWWPALGRRSRPELFCEKSVLKKFPNFTNFTENYLCRGLFLIKLYASDLQLYKKRDADTVDLQLFLKHFQ